MNVEIYNEDCVAGMGKHLADESVDMCVTSIPFGALFMYSGKKEDIGNNQDGTDMRAGQFGLHMRFFITQLLRVMKPGTVACIHIQQLFRYKNQHGYMGRRDFRGAVVELFTACGFEWTGEVVIPKDPQIMAQRLSLHSLMFITGKRDSRAWAPAVNDYVMIFRKPGEPVTPCAAMHDPQMNPGGWMSSEQWIKWASGTWDDILETDILDGWRSAREVDEEKHVCPLQLSVILRCISMYCAPDGLVLDPFMGIGSTAYVARGGRCQDGVLREPRRAIGFELKESYYQLALRNLELLETKLANDRRDLFSQEAA